MSGLYRLGLACMMVCALDAQESDADHVSACVHYGVCDVRWNISRIAQGSIFDTGGQIQGPAFAPVVSGFPLQTKLAGVSVQVTIGDRTVDALILSVDPIASGNTTNFRVRAVLPSGTPLGDARVLVRYKGDLLSSPVNNHNMLVVGRDVGLYRTSEGRTAAQNISSSGSLRTNTLAEAATPGQLVALWGTGLGATSADEAAGPAPGDLGIEDLQVLVADKLARVVYAGRSGCCAGVDQIIFEIPAGIEGCAVPVVVRFSNDGSESNAGHLSIAAHPGACPTGLPADLTQKYLSGMLVFGSAGGSHFDDSSQPLSAGFTAGAYPWQLETPYGMPYGSCFGTAGVAGASDNVVQGPGLRSLDAGRQINFRTPEGSVTLNPYGVAGNKFSPLRYIAAAPTDHLASGEYGLDNGVGGPDIGSFQDVFSIPDLSFVWTNIDSFNAVTASQDLPVTWKAGSSDGYVIIGGGYAYAPGLKEEDGLEAGFLCIERADKGAFTVPGRMLWRAKGSPVPDLVLQMSVSKTFTHRFTVPGLDVGEFTWTTGFSKIFKFQ